MSSASINRLGSLAGTVTVQSLLAFLVTLNICALLVGHLHQR